VLKFDFQVGGHNIIKCFFSEWSRYIEIYNKLCSNVPWVKLDRRQILNWPQMNNETPFYILSRVYRNNERYAVRINHCIFINQLVRYEIKARFHCGGSLDLFYYNVRLVFRNNIGRYWQQQIRNKLRIGQP